MTDVMGGEEPEEAQAVIDLIDQIGTVTLENREAIEAARNAYDALTEEQQSYVTNYSVLTAAEAELKALEEQAADQAAADAVTEQINSLPAADALTLEDKAAVEAAREAYEALTDAQKQYVTEETVTALEELENRIQELEDAEEPEQAYVTVAIEKFTIGQGYLVEPVLVEITEGESTAQILDRVLGENGLRYDNTGSVDSSFYLSWILDEAGSLTAEFPEISLKHAEEQGIKITNPRRRATLGEFDYTNHQSGWMYTLNNDMPNVGMSDTEPKDGDVIRIRFTAMKGDLCSGNGYVDDVHGWNFYSGNSQIFVGEEDSHGTHAAGTIAAVRGSYGIAGITDNNYVKIMSLKALGGSDGTGSPDSVIQAIRYAEANGAAICNLSMGTSAYNEALAQTMQNSKMLFIVACGNGGIE